MSLADVREGLRAAFKAVHPNWNVYGTIQEVTHLPAMIVVPNYDGTAADYGTDFSGSVTWDLRVLVLVEIADRASADRTLSAMASPDEPLSVPQILDMRKNRELRGAGIGVAICKKMRNYGREYPAAGTTAMGAEFTLEVEEE